MTNRIRGADLVVRTLDLAGIGVVFALSGNHVMPIYDAAFGKPLKIIHARHEAATVYMADAWARLTGRCGVALVSSGAGHANAIGSLPTARASDVPLLLLSGHAALSEQGRGGFQELRQADMAEPACKASRIAEDVKMLAHEVARCIREALSGRPGPVHLSLPIDLLNATVIDEPALWPKASDFAPVDLPVVPSDIENLRRAVRNSKRPILLAGSYLCRGSASQDLASKALELAIPIVGMQSPRGLNDPSLGAFANTLRQADLIVLLGKPLDFTLGFGLPPAVHADCRFVVVDPDLPLIDRAKRELGERLDFALHADPLPMLRALTAADLHVSREASWPERVETAIEFRPEVWPSENNKPGGLVHPADLSRALKVVLDRNPKAILICDGGEVPQWPQTLRVANRRIINGVAASIGAATPFAIGAREATHDPVIAVSGDGAFGFHALELDTALRHDLPIVVVVGNDAAWNAEHQIQLRSYGAGRAHGCKLLPTRYDKLAVALGGYGEYVTRKEDLVPAIERALASGLPSCVNVQTLSVTAPVVG